MDILKPGEVRETDVHLDGLSYTVHWGCNGVVRVVGHATGKVLSRNSSRYGAVVSAFRHARPGGLVPRPNSGQLRARSKWPFGRSGIDSLVLPDLDD